MKKILSFLLLGCLLSIGNVWAQEPTLAFNTESQGSTFLGEYSEFGVTISTTESFSSGAVQLGNTPSSYDQRYLEILSSDAEIEKVSYLISGNGSNKKIMAPVFGWETTATSNQADTYVILDEVTVTANSYAAAQWFTYDFSAASVKCLRIYRTTKYISSTNPEYTGSSTALGSGQTIKIYGIKIWLKAPAGPTIITQPEGASYVTGATISELTVEASASAGTLSYQWYSCDDAEKNNAAEIDGATSSSYTPSAAGFYYVEVTDDNGTVASNVVEIEVSAAAAPTISISADVDLSNGVAVGTIVTLTADVDGNPTPSIQWYDQYGVAIDGATELTYLPSTEAAGSFSFHALATNSVDAVQSNSIAVVVKEKVATPVITPNGAYFDGTQDVTIACETEGATIMYSVDNGENWGAYIAALSLSETSTIKAKAIKDGCIDSEIASADFHKVSLVEQTDVTGAATWDWAAITSGEINLSAPILNVDVVMANIPAYGYTLTAPAEFNAQNLLVNCQYAWRNANGAKFLQGSKIQFNTTVAGVVTVEYANTGNNAARTVVVNDVKGSGEVENNTDYISESFAVGAGSVEIKGVQVSDDAGKMLRIRKVVFTPNVDIVLGENGFSTYAADYKFTVSGAEVYMAALNLTGDAVVLTKVDNAVVPAEEGIILKGVAGETATIIRSGEEASNFDANELVGLVEETEAEASYYVLSTNDGVTMFNPCQAGLMIPAHKALLVIDSETPAPVRVIFAENGATAIDNIEGADEAVKFVENGVLYIRRNGVVYTTTGQVVR